MAEETRTTKKPTHLLPIKQQLVLELEPKLKRLAQDFPEVTCCIEDADLLENVAEIFGKLGIQSHEVSGNDFNTCFPPLLKAFRQGHLLLLHYRKKRDESTQNEIFKELKQSERYRSLKTVIPIFFAYLDHEKERNVLRLLSGFDIQYVIYITPYSSSETKLKTLFLELLKYQQVILEGIALEEEADPGLSSLEADQNTVILKYRTLLTRAEDLMDSDPEQAIALFSEAIELSPNFDALIRRGDAYFKIQKYLSALKDYQEANRLENGRADPYAKMSACCFVMVRRSALAGQKELAQKWFQTGMTSLKKAEDLVLEMEKEENFSPDFSVREPYKFILSAVSETDFRGLGLEEEEKQVEELSAWVLSKTKDMDLSGPGCDVNTRIDYAILLTRKRRYAEAESIFRALITEDPNIVGPAFNNFAVELRKNGEYGMAFLIYKEVLRYGIPDRDIVIKNFVTAGRRYAKMKTEKSDLEESVQIYKDLLNYAALEHGREWVLCERSVTHLAMRDQAQASSCLMEALYLNPKLYESKEFEAFPELKSLIGDMATRLTRISL